MKKTFKLNDTAGAVISVNIEGGEVTAILSDNSGSAFKLTEINTTEKLTPEQLKAISEEGRIFPDTDKQPF